MRSVRRARRRSCCSPSDALCANPWLRVASLAIAAAPAYVLFALCLMITRLQVRGSQALGPPAAAEMRISDMEWPLLQWVRYMAASHVVRTFAGLLFRGTPVWTLYLRLNGARIGRGVYVNSLSVSDHNLLTFGDDVVIGAEVHLSGHTVEAGRREDGDGDPRRRRHDRTVQRRGDRCGGGTARAGGRAQLRAQAHPTRGG